MREGRKEKLLSRRRGGSLSSLRRAENTKGATVHEGDGSESVSRFDGGGLAWAYQGATGENVGDWLAVIDYYCAGD